ncbi:DUF1993 domain-containing protein [Novosphingobium sp. 1949]|uniref:DUF1993 domain-containing protein n=1 Tax=Novosphingobium organovorum TaxID=2930092 RepID=A0ABT0BF91_9SPHN|nr:DUF1993 domain-containing protein [Novosphingobium organovorum]MCJ2183638.1 DUF1993 domain-containing protein [Novosphingobium organovorum]
MTPTALLVPTYRNMLRMLLGLLRTLEDQAPARAQALLGARLAPDMYPLATQVRYAALQAQEALYRLRGEPRPDALTALGEEARAAADNPGTLAQARARIEEALAALDTLSPCALDTSGETPVAIELPGDLAFDMSGAHYVRDWALPQFYFHVVTAYAILRAEGIAIGKANFVPHMFAYKRP